MVGGGGNTLTIFMIKGKLLENKRFDTMTVAHVINEGNGEHLWRARGAYYVPMEYKYNKFPDLTAFYIYVLKNVKLDIYYR